MHIISTILYSASLLASVTAQSSNGFTIPTGLSDGTYEMSLAKDGTTNVVRSTDKATDFTPITHARLLRRDIPPQSKAATPQPTITNTGPMPCPKCAPTASKKTQIPSARLRGTPSVFGSQATQLCTYACLLRSPSLVMLRNIINVIRGLIRSVGIGRLVGPGLRNGIRRMGGLGLGRRFVGWLWSEC